MSCFSAGIGHALPAEGSDSKMAPTAGRFEPAANGEFSFNTGVLKGLLHAGGRSLGLSSVVHIPTGLRLDRSNGLVSHYRVFTWQKRYGGGAWDWPSTATLSADGSVEVNWPSAEGRPFEFKAIYRWHDPSTIDVTTQVHALSDLSGFESFLASYFSESFTNCQAYVSENPERGGGLGFMAAKKTIGDWIMFPRDPKAVSLIQDGRWKLEPNPVAWVIAPSFNLPLCFRKSPNTGVTAVLITLPNDCFAIATPQEGEGHYSLYLSLFGRDIKAGKTARARTRLWIANNPSEQDIIKAYRDYIPQE